MTTMTFKTEADLTAALAFDLNDEVKAIEWEGLEVSADFGASERSISSYSEISFYDAETGEHVRTIKVRFSDHGDRYGSDVTVRIDGKFETIQDDGEYIETAISASNYAALLNEALEFVKENA